VSDIIIHRTPSTSYSTDQIPVHNHGFIQLVDFMGSDLRILQAARVSTGTAVSKGEEKDRRLIHYLMKNHHTSPFEMVEFLWHVRAPMFVARQWVRHRICEWNEESGRYKELRTDFFLPDTFRLQGTHHNAQKSDAAFDDTTNTRLREQYNNVFMDNKKCYQSTLEQNGARELARIALPLATYTEWYWKVNGHALMNFLKLRCDRDHAQPEIADYADIMLDIFKQLMPITAEAFQTYILDTYSVSKTDWNEFQEFKSKNQD